MDSCLVGIQYCIQEAAISNIIVRPQSDGWISCFHSRHFVLQMNMVALHRVRWSERQDLIFVPFVNVFLHDASASNQR